MGLLLNMPPSISGARPVPLVAARRPGGPAGGPSMPLSERPPGLSATPSRTRSRPLSLELSSFRTWGRPGKSRPGPRRPIMVPAGVHTGGNDGMPIMPLDSGDNVLGLGRIGTSTIGPNNSKSTTT
jgi:hypothetical protein